MLRADKEGKHFGYAKGWTQGYEAGKAAAKGKNGGKGKDDGKGKTYTGFELVAKGGASSFH